MNVACPQCTSVFRVDPAKVPAGGVRARCSVCSGVINVPEPSFEEPVAAAGTPGWPSTSAPQWGRVNTPEGGWTPPPPPAAPPAQSQHTAPAYTPPQPQPAQSAAWETPPAPTSADWGEWPSQSSPFGAPPESPLAAHMPASDPWGGFTGNPLAPEAPTPPYSSPSVPPPPFESPPAPSFEQSAPQPEPRVEPELVPEAATQEPAVPGEKATETATHAESASAWVPEPERPATQPAEAQGSPSAAQTPAGAHVNPFLRRDPHERARRLARALASDIVVYYPEKHAEGLRDGNLRELFREEIKKSYDDYVAHVGAELAQSTTYFQDALNEVLAGGKRLF